MNFNVGLYPIYGLVVGVKSYVKIDIVMHTVQFALFVIIVEITWDSSQY
jgi:hypothetical protein